MRSNKRMAERTRWWKAGERSLPPLVSVQGCCYHHGMTAAGRIARVRIELDDTDPVIWRRAEAPLAITLKGLDDVIQGQLSG